MPPGEQRWWAESGVHFPFSNGKKTAVTDHTATPAVPEAVYKQLPPICTSGGEFLRKFARLSNGDGGDGVDRQWKCAFCLTRDGRVVKVQRTIFSECFYVLALDELSRVTGDQDMQVD